MTRWTHEQNVGQNAAQHAGLHNADFALLERNNRDLRRLENAAARSGALLTMSSTAFPNVAFISPPSVWPSFADSSSVAKLSSAASGMMAMKLRMKVTVGFQFIAPATMPSGTKTSRTLT